MDGTSPDLKALQKLLQNCLRVFSPAVSIGAAEAKNKRGSQIAH
jgi:hypothetical protein